MTQEPLYHEGHPKRIDQDSQGINADTPSHPKNKKKDDRNLHASSPNTVTPEEPNDISASDAETESGDEHEPGDNVVMRMWRLNLRLILITHNLRDTIRMTSLLGSMVKKGSYGFRDLCPFLLSHPRKRTMRILSALLKC